MDNFSAIFPQIDHIRILRISNFTFATQGFTDKSIPDIPIYMISWYLTNTNEDSCYLHCTFTHFPL